MILFKKKILTVLDARAMRDPGSQPLLPVSLVARQLGLTHLLLSDRPWYVSVPLSFFSLGSQYHLISAVALWFSLSLSESVTPPLTPSLFLSSPFLSFSQSPFQFFFQFYSESMTHFTTLVVYFSHFLLCWFLFFMLIVICELWFYLWFLWIINLCTIFFLAQN